MANKAISDQLWERIKPLLPRKKAPSRRGGRPPIDDRLVLEAILFVLESGIPWRLLPRQFGCSRMTCWRRIQEWQKRGIWNSLHVLLLAELQRRGRIRWSRAAIDSSSVRALEDRAYDSEPVRKQLARLHITPYLAKRNTPHGSGLGKYRWVVERTISWLHGLRRLRLRWERRADIHQAFITLAACIICLRFLLR